MSNASPFEQVFPGIVRACECISRDYGGINADQSREEFIVKLAKWMDSEVALHPSELRKIDDWLAAQTETDTQVLCCGEDSDQQRILVGAPAGTNDFLNAWFTKDC